MCLITLTYEKISLVGDEGSLSLLPCWRLAFSLLELAWPQGAGLLSCGISGLSDGHTVW